MLSQMLEKNLSSSGDGWAGGLLPVRGLTSAALRQSEDYREFVIYMWIYVCLTYEND